MVMLNEFDVLGRFIPKFVVNDETGCWEWTGVRSGSERGGYGYLKVGGKHQPAHRVSYELFVGPIPDSLEIDHLCMVRRCVNPRHLRTATHAENMGAARRARMVKMTRAT